MDRAPQRFFVVVPRAFRSLRMLSNLNVGAVGLSLAAATTAIMSHVGERNVALFIGVPTLMAGGAWAALLRWRATLGSSSIRWGWLLSVPIAALNGSVCCALTMVSSGSVTLESLFGGALLGATLGAIIWLPALFATLLFFGTPIARAQSLAKKGLAGEERGERIVGLACALVAIGAMLVAGWSPHPAGALFGVFSIGGLSLGVFAAVLAYRRERERKRFVEATEAGNVSGYRVEASPEGKVLLRVAENVGYRVSDFTEEVYQLDERGAATRQAAQRPMT